MTKAFGVHFFKKNNWIGFGNLKAEDKFYLKDRVKDSLFWLK